MTADTARAPRPASRNALRDQSHDPRARSTSRVRRDADTVLEVVRVTSGEQWHTVGRRAVGWLAATGAPFSVWDVHLLGVGEPPDTPNRWGALMAACAASGLLQPCGIEASRRASRRGAVVTVWIGAGREAVAA